MSHLLYLLRLLGTRPAVFFGLVSFVVVALLAAVQVTSHYALKAYADDQLDRIPWDISIYQPSKTGLPRTGEVRQRIAAQSGVTAVENIYFLRAAVPTIRAYVDDQPFRSPWISVLMASDISMLPAELRPRGQGAVLALLGKKSLTGDAYLHLQQTRKFRLSEATQRRGRQRQVFEIPLDSVIRVERDGLNRWFMEQTSSPTYVPDIGAILVMPFDWEVLRSFDAVGRGIELAGTGQDIHELAGKYVPEVIHLVRLDRPSLVSTWDLPGSRQRAEAVGERLRHAARLDAGFTIGIDNTTGVLFQRMAATAKQIALLVLLVALPLLGMAWVLLANLARLIMLNQRRLFGLLRLRGAPGRMMGLGLTLAIGAGGLLGGVLGSVAGTYLPLLYYGVDAPGAVVADIQSPANVIAFILIGIVLTLFVARPLVRYAATISPIEGAAQVSFQESEAAGFRFGWLPALALLLGGIKLFGWLGGWRLPQLSFLVESSPQWRALDRGFDFIAFPLFIYGVTVLIAGRHRWMIGMLSPFVRLHCRDMASVVLEHVASKPHRASALVLVVALLSSVSLYPTVMTAVFDNKLERAALVQLGGEVQLTFEVPDLLDPEAATVADEGLELARRFPVVRQAVAELRGALDRLPEVAGTTFVTEGLVEGLYMPGYGLEGVPVYLLDSASDYLSVVYHEPAIGLTMDFASMIRSVDSSARVLTSPPVGDFWKRQPGQPLPVGRTANGSTLRLPAGGTVNFIPGGAVASVDDRDSFISERVDYLNHLFRGRAFLAAGTVSGKLDELDALLPRVMLVVRAAPGVGSEELRTAVEAALPVAPARTRDLTSEVGRLGSDMYVYLARENMRIYLVGGIIMAIIGIVTVALLNFLEDRRTLTLLRARGAGPRQIGRFLSGVLLGPGLLGLLLGTLVALLVGFGMTNLVWELRDLETVMRYLPTRLAVSALSLGVFALLLAVLLAVTSLFRAGVVRRVTQNGRV